MATKGDQLADDPDAHGVGSDPDQSYVKRLTWLATLVPAAGVFLFETARHSFLEDRLPTFEGNILAGLLVLALAFVFSEGLFRTIQRVQARAVLHGREVATLRAIVQERERLSRELHDGLAQVVSYLLVRLDTVADLVRSGREAEARTELEALRRVTDDLYADVRESISGLRSRVVELGFTPALREYLEEFEERHGIAVSLDAGIARRLAASAELQLFRIAQEALANVRKHSGARHAEVAITPRPAGILELVIADDGCGFDPAPVEEQRLHSFGLTGMRERAQALGGICQIESRPGFGTKIVIQVPVGAGLEQGMYEAHTAAAGR